MVVDRVSFEVVVVIDIVDVDAVVAVSSDGVTGERVFVIVISVIPNVLKEDAFISVQSDGIIRDVVPLICMVKKESNGVFGDIVVPDRVVFISASKVYPLSVVMNGAVGDDALCCLIKTYAFAVMRGRCVIYGYLWGLIDVYSTVTSGSVFCIAVANGDVA